MSDVELTATQVADAYVAAVVPPGLPVEDRRRGVADARAFLDVLLRHVAGEPGALDEIGAVLAEVAGPMVSEGRDAGVLLDRFDAGRHAILDALLRSGAGPETVSRCDERLGEAQLTVRTAIRDAAAAHERVVGGAVAEVTEAIEGGASPDEAMHVAAAALCRLVHADRARVWLDVGSGRLELVASAGSTSPMGFYVSSEAGVIADILRGGVPVRQCPVDPEEWEAAVPNLPIPASALFVPIAAAGRPIGMLYALRNQPVRFSDAEERLGAQFVLRVEPALAWAMQLRSLQRWAQASQDFLRITTHELRRPLTVLRGYLDMLDSVGPEQAVLLRERMGRAAEQLATLLTGITDTATLEDPARELKVSTTTVSEVFELLLESAADEAEQHAARLVVDVQEGATELRCDLDNVVHALANLVSNAISHTRGERRVWLSAAPEGRRLVRFVVRDEGRGITPGDESKLFLKYYRSDETRREGIPGSGLGLYFVRLVAERHGGRVAAENAPDGGACFTLELPLEPGMVAWSI